MAEVYCKETYWEPADCKEDVEILFISGKSYHVFHENKTAIVIISKNKNISQHLIRFYIRIGNPRPTNLPIFEHYFASKSELRKLKLDKLKNGRSLL